MAEQQFTTEELATEEWRELSEYPSYFASNLGRIRRNAEILKIKGGAEYPQVRINRQVNAERRPLTKNIHPLIAEAFIGPRPPKHVINHKDGQKQNNRVANLEYVTHSQNYRHAVEIGTMRRASGYYPIIKRLRDAGVADDVIKSAFQLSDRRMQIMKRRCR